VDASGSILRRNVRAFQVDSGTHLSEKRIAPQSVSDDSQLANHLLIRRSDERREKASDTGGSQGEGCPMKVLSGEQRAIEIHAGKPIDLGIEKTRAQIQILRTEIARRSLSRRINLDDLPMFNDDVYRRLCSWNVPSNDHLNFASSIHNDSRSPWVIIARLMFWTNDLGKEIY
jgi:hypothetical protein